MSRLGRISENEQIFERKRNELLESVDLKRFIDDPFLFLRRQRVSEILTRFTIYQQTINIAGSIVECGCRQGGSLMIFYHLASILEPFNLTRKIYGFDTFEGFRSLSEHDDNKLDEDIFANVDYDVLNRAIEIHDYNRPIGHVPKIELIKGDATKTIPVFKEQHPELTISLLYLDFDIYNPTVVALEHLFPLVPKGGIVVFDEFNDERWAGETKALKEYFKINEITLKRFPFDPLPAYFIV